MALLIGQPIDARELELSTSSWPPERFASMCNDLVWATSSHQFAGLPSLTLRINAADDGIDAEWDVPIPDTDGSLPTPIVGRGWNVFQYKKRDCIAQDRKRIVSSLKSNLKKAIAEIVARTGKVPDRYILFVNVDLKGDEFRALKEAISKDYEGASKIHVEIIGAAGLTALLNSNPHLREAYFAPLSFKTWDEANRAHRTQKLFGFDVDLVGRGLVLDQLRALIDDPQVRVVVVAGPHDIGKSRLVLEATSHRVHDVVFALDPRSMKLDDYRKLVADRHDVICVVEDPEPDRIQTFVNEILGIERLKLVITLPNSGFAVDSFYGMDKRVQCLALGALSDEDSRKLLSTTGKRLDFGVESWILDRAGGTPGILLAAASVAENLRGKTSDFEDAVGREFEKRIKTALGETALKCAELLSILTHVGISGKFETEVKAVSEIFSGGWQTAEVISVLEKLEGAGVARRGGSFAEVTIPMLANYLAAKLLRGRKNGIFALFAKLDELALIRFLRRLSQVRKDAVDRFWDALFDTNDPDAPFGNFRSALRQSHMLRFLAGAVPERTLRLLESGLRGTSREERLAISDEPRRELMWALEQLLFRSRTSGHALRLLWLLAEAENEKWGNNATGVLSECFHPMHRQMPLPLKERLDALQQFTSQGPSREGKLVAIRAASKALEHGSYTLRHSTGAEPLDKWPVFTRREAYDYVRDLVDHFFRVAEAEDNEIAQEALEELPRLVFELGVQGQPQEALERFERLVEWAKTERPGLDIFSLCENIEVLRQSLQDHLLQESGMTDTQKREFQGHVSKANRLKGALEKGNFPLRLKRWATGWSREDHEKVIVKGVETRRSALELTNLAKETIAEPALLTSSLVSWLLSGSAQNAPNYFFQLGRYDLKGGLRSSIEQFGSRVDGARAFSAYWGGWATVDRTQAEQRLIDLAASNAICGEAVVWAAGYLGPSEAVVRIIKKKILEGRISPKIASGVLYGDWVGGLSVEQFLGLVQVIAGTQLENAALAIDVIERWLDQHQALEGDLAEFAWQCLEAAPSISSVTSHEAYACDRLASKLALSNLQRGFKLLEKLLTQPHERQCWNPIDRYGAGESDFWKTLHKIDRERALRSVLSLASMDSLERFRITWDLRDIIDQKGDSDLLVGLALESESQAELIAESITTARSGFWPIALKIIEEYPTNERIQSALATGIEQAGEAQWGPYSQHLESCRQQVEQKLNDVATPPAARLWLRDVLRRMEGEIGQHVIWEYDEDVNSLQRYIEEEDSPNRIWAIGRILKNSDLKDIRRLLSVTDIAEVLPQVDLPEKKRKALEKALEVWQSGG